MRLLRELIYFEPSSRKTDIGKSLTELGKILKRRSILFIISDFISEGFEKPLKYLRKRHDVVLINLSDVREEEIPDIGYVLLEDEETGEQILVNTSDESFRKFYEKSVRRRREELERKMKKLKVDMIYVRTDEPFYMPLMRFFNMRKRRIR